MYCKLWEGHPWFWEIALSFTKIHHHISFSCPYIENHACLCPQHPGWWQALIFSCFGLLLPVQPRAAIVYKYLIMAAAEDSRTTAYTGRWVMCESHHQPSTAHPFLCPINHPHMRGMYKLLWKKERKQPPEQPLPPSTPTLGQQVQKLPGEQKVLSFVNAATPHRRFWWGMAAEERDPNAPSPAACPAPSTFWLPVVANHSPSSPQLSCAPSALTACPALKGLRPPSLSPHHKDVFLLTVGSWDHLVCWITLLPSGAHFPAFQNKQLSCPKCHMSAGGAAACAAWWFLHTKATSISPEVSLPTQDQNHRRLITDKQTLFQAGAASAEPLARPLGWCPFHSSA